MKNLMHRDTLFLGSVINAHNIRLLMSAQFLGSVINVHDIIYVTDQEIHLGATWMTWKLTGVNLL